jgi:hypothetical protein
MKSYICGCVRNCGPHLDAVFANIDTIAGLFEETTIVIAYDVSEDNSLAILQQKQMIYGSRMILLQNPNPVSQIRTQNIANARNSIFKAIGNNPTSLRHVESYEYMIMLDMDDVCAGPMDISVLSRFMGRDDWDMLSFNKPDYYDIWALSIVPCLFSCWHLEDPYGCVAMMKRYITERLARIADDELLECASAFNGFGIYRLSKFVHCSYGWELKPNIKLTEKLFPNFIDANCRALDRRVDIRFNSDCEHRWFHMSAILLNNARIRISKLCLFTK